MKKMIAIVASLFVTVPVAAAESFHDFTVTSIEYTDMPMAQYAGKAILLVNTASKCGFTPQYEGLQKLWSTYKDKGLIVLGVPSNDFGAQEKGTEEEIKKFCTINFDVDFPMTKKMVVNGGKGNAEMYDWLAEELGDASRPKWNFHKYLISPEGQAVAFFPSTVTPNSDELLAVIDQTLTH